MTVANKPFYWLECDSPDCGEVFPNPDDNEVMAYADQSSLIELAPDSEWFLVNGKHYCQDHAFSYCRLCGSAFTEDELLTGEGECFKCAPELVERT